ncbi:50S ribosomal protein L9 [endosymbiont of Sipalinus gigas]|uniref:50S ribosomal protein L9 n=1 Tax=endosymbiont of Sipalinus gigas TaxID=1972134 RepID=UPI000DC72711|nr:50S ribosomal protein L9 [endosymbiont of Sipalinus gigas]BBA85338.1 50S ribosomal protein L9 [endosymbiont of Sipalinus gigas]
MIKIILIKKINNLGNIGNIVLVKNGYAMNFLLPNNFAIIATKNNINNINNKINEVNLSIEYKNKYIKEIKDKIIKLSLNDLTIYMKLIDEKKIFGSINKIDIIKILNNKDIKINKNQIILNKPIKIVGEHLIKIKIHNSILELNINILGNN